MQLQSPRIRSTRHAAAALLTAATLVGGLCLRADAAQFGVPALCDPATGAHRLGKLLWLDLETTDLAGAKRFYRELFGWDYRDYHSYGGDYTVALMAGKPIAGIVTRPILNDTERRSAWLPFFSVTDVDTTFARALEIHGAVRSEPENVPQRGWQARLTDPEGAVFALLASSSGDPSDDPNPRAYGTWGPPSLWASDPAAEAVFYQDLFHYGALGLPTGAGFEDIVLSGGTPQPHASPQSGGSPQRATIRPLPGGEAPGGEAWKPQWISFVRVFSTADTARQAVKLGGRIRVPATRAAHGTTTAILEDPSGGVFGVVELPPETADLAHR